MMFVSTPEGANSMGAIGDVIGNFSSSSGKASFHSVQLVHSPRSNVMKSCFLNKITTVFTCSDCTFYLSALLLHPITHVYGLGSRGYGLISIKM